MPPIIASMAGAGWVAAALLAVALSAMAVRLRALERRRREETAASRRLQGGITAHAAHELRTPLNAVIGFATLIEQGAVSGPEESRELAAQIRGSAERLHGLLNHILDPDGEPRRGPAGTAAGGPARPLTRATGEDEPAWERREANR